MEPSVSRLALYQEAAKLSASLCAFVEQRLPLLDQAEGDTLGDYASFYAASLERLNRIFIQIGNAPIDRDENSACERLRLQIRQDLECCAKFEVPCREVLQKQLAVLKSELLVMQKKKSFSAYLHPTTLGTYGNHLDRHG